eukprot:Clim_evm2s134 gene=Clim_evmTU2s134
MKFHFAAVAAVAAVAAAVTSGAAAHFDDSPALSEVVRRQIADLYAEEFTSEAARQRFLAGENDEDFTESYWFTQKTFVNGGECENAVKVKNAAVLCGVYDLDENDNNQIILSKDLSINGTLTIGDSSFELEAKQGDKYFQYYWKLNSEEPNVDEDQKWSLKIGETGKDLTFDVTSDLHDSMWALQFNKGGFWQRTYRLYWYRMASASMPDNTHTLWCGFSGEPRCK